MSNKVLSSDAVVGKDNDAILKINELAKEKKRNGESVINGSIGMLYSENGHLVNFSSVENAMHTQIKEESKTYPPITGGPNYKKAVLKWLFKENYQKILDKYQIDVVSTPGGTGSIFLGLRCYADKNQSVMLPSIGWTNYEALVSQTGSNFVHYNVFKDGGFDVDGILSQAKELILKEHRLFFLINDPCQNPTGYSLTKIEWEKLLNGLKSLEQYGTVVIFIDVAYIDFADPKNARQVFSLLGNISENMMVLIGFSASKTFSIYGLRTGALVAVSQSKDDITAFKKSAVNTSRAVWSCSNAYGINVVSSILNDEKEFLSLENDLDNSRKMLIKRGLLFIKEAKEVSLSTYPYSSGFFITIKANNAQEVVDLLAKNHNIFLVAIKKDAIRLALSSIKYEEVFGLAKKIKQYCK